MQNYTPQTIEKKWQEYWDTNQTFVTDQTSDKPKFYALDMFPYPSGAGLHVGHPKGYTATDIFARYRRMKGDEVLHPMGWDAFGLPAENYAIKTQVHPDKSTKNNIDNFRRQIKSLGFSYDWNREISTCDPEYYKWTQWWFLFLYEQGLAYKKKAPVNWCNDCKTVLANEQVIDNKCERCKNEVAQKKLSQWFFKITDFIEDQGNTSGLINGLDKIDWPHSTKTSQVNWIGKSEGAAVNFEINVSRRTEYFDLEDVDFSSIYLITFNTQDGEVLEKDEIRHLKRIFGDIARNHEFYIARGVVMPDHVHLIISDPKERDMGDLVRLIKGGASRFLKISMADVSSTITSDLSPTLSRDESKNQPKNKTTALSEKISGRIHPSGGHHYEKLWRDGYHFDPIKSADDLERAVGYVENNPEKAKIFDQDRVFSDNERVTVFTTRPDTLFGATFMVLAPEHPLVNEITTTEQKEAVDKYKAEAKHKSELDRQSEKEKTGVFTGGYAINPVNNEKIPIWIADYVLMGYGTGAIMAVPAHDERDFEFAKKYDIPITRVIEGGDLPYADSGNMVNSGEFTGLSNTEGKAKITAWLSSQGIGKKETTYRLRDWSVSRQRYWGAPIPIIHCPDCGEVPVPEDQLPVTLPTDVDFMPTGESPMKYSKTFHEVNCPKCGSHEATRENDTMDTFVCSSWYFFAFDQVGTLKNGENPMKQYVAPASITSDFLSTVALAKEESPTLSKNSLPSSLPVDLYVGGAEHTVLHLLYSRFFTKAAHRAGLIDFDEPFTKLRHQGMILAEGGQKMSKSLGNVINPDEIVEKYGADTLRMYEMFMGPFDQAISWSTAATEGIFKFLQKVWRVYHEKELIECGSNGSCPLGTSKELRPIMHKTIKKVTEDIETLKFNTAISQMMIFVNTVQKSDVFPRPAAEKFCKLLAPFAPHMAEEIWHEVLGHKNSITFANWPQYNPEFIQDEVVTYAVQVNGKVRGDFTTDKNTSKEDAISIAKTQEKVVKYLKRVEIVKEIFIPGKIVGFVVK